MARPKTKVALRSLREYIDIILEEMPPATYIQDVMEGKKRYPDWRDNALRNLLNRGSHGTFATEEEYVKEIISGRQAFTWDFVRAMHSILELNVWGLDFTSLWQNDDASDLRHNPQDFRGILCKARMDQPDPFREFSSLKSSGIETWVSATRALIPAYSTDSAAPEAVMQFGDKVTLTEHKMDFGEAPTLVFSADEQYMLSFTARCNGRILLVGQEHLSKKIYILNDILGLGDLEDLKAGAEYTGAIWRATSQKSDWDLAIIFLSTELLETHVEVQNLLHFSQHHSSQSSLNEVHPAKMSQFCRILRDAHKTEMPKVDLGLHYVLIR